MRTLLLGMLSLTTISAFGSEGRCVAKKIENLNLKVSSVYTQYETQQGKRAIFQAAVTLCTGNKNADGVCVAKMMENLNLNVTDTYTNYATPEGKLNLLLGAARLCAN